MGWGSGVDIFDSVVAAVIELNDAHNHPHLIQEIVDAVYGAFADSDWDTEADSNYWFPYLLETMHKLGHVDDEDYALYNDDQSI